MSKIFVFINENNEFHFTSQDRSFSFPVVKIANASGMCRTCPGLDLMRIEISLRNDSFDILNENKK